MLLLVTPAVITNGLWWHPDGLGLLFVSLTMLFLLLDNLKLQNFFYLAAISAGIASGIKYIGLFFFLTIPTYLLFGYFQKKFDLKKLLVGGFFFVLVMFATIVISNPLLLLPLERSEIIRVQTSQFMRTTSGEMLGKQPLLENGRLPDWLVSNYGGIFFILLLCAALLSGFFHKKNRLHASIIATFIIPQLVTISAAALRREHYFLPIYYPLAAALAFILPEKLQDLKFWKNKNYWMIPVIIILSVQTVFFLRDDYFLLMNMKNRERNSASIAFYNAIKDKHINSSTAQPVTIYRDWHVYFPENSEEVDVFLDWDLASYEMLETKKPDYLLLDNAYITTYGAEGFLDIAADAQRLAGTYQFYADAYAKDIDGYHLTFENAFGSVFEREDGVIRP